MGQFWKVLLFVLAVSNLGTSLENFYLTKLLSESIAVEYNLTSCLLSIIRDPSLNFMVNIGIRIESESNFSRRDFTYTVEKLIALNGRVAVNQGSGEKEPNDIHGWFFFIDSVKSLELVSIISIFNKVVLVFIHTFRSQNSYFQTFNQTPTYSG